MGFPSSMHVHTIYSDGTGTCEEYVREALRKGFVSLGFSEHAYAPYDEACCIKGESIPLYHSEVHSLARRYADRLEIYAGLEVDWYNLAEKSGWDFVIGSVHYLRSEKNGRYYSIDNNTGEFIEALEWAAGGDIRAMVSQYFDMVARMALEYRPNILGHIDLITKLNAGGRFFDEASGWYGALCDSLCERIARAGCIVEVNTGAMHRGYTDKPYPSERMLRRLYALRVPVTLTSDAHDVAGLDAFYDEALALIYRVGYRAIKIMRGGRFVDLPLEPM